MWSHVRNQIIVNESEKLVRAELLFYFTFQMFFVNLFNIFNQSNVMNSYERLGKDTIGGDKLWKEI